MTAVVRAEEPSARYIAELEPALLRGFGLLASAPGGVAKLRQLILEFATLGKLTAQSHLDDLVRIAKVDTLKASKMLGLWREQGLLEALAGRGKRNMAYAKPAQAGEQASLLSELGENNPGAGK